MLSIININNSFTDEKELPQQFLCQYVQLCIFRRLVLLFR